MLEKTFFSLFSTYSDDKDYMQTCWKELKTSYSGASRHYHNLSHIQTMLTELEMVKHLAEDLDCLQFAIFYHDVIYKSTRSDNEHKSALKFKEHIGKTGFKNLEKCFAQIEETKEHKVSKFSDTNLLLDLDLAILGSDEQSYYEYAKNIRKEYKVFPDFVYKRGRKKVLRHLLEIENLYKLPFFRDKYASRAKGNLEKELKSLIA